jgi:hypothetical protein
MVYRINLIAIALILQVTFVFAQEKYDFQIKYSPNSIYSSKMETNGDVLVDVNVDEETKAKLAKAGQIFPMKMNMQQLIEASMKTLKINAEGKIPFSITYDKIDFKQQLNGKDIRQSEGQNALLDVVLNGNIIGVNELEVTNIAGLDSNMTLKNSLETSFSKMYEMVKFPNNRVGVGESFTQEIPMNIPVAGKQIEVMIKTLYKLRYVKKDQAFFVITQEVKMKTKYDGISLNASGSGDGAMIFDMVSNNFVAYRTDSKIKINMDVPSPDGTIKMIMDMDVESKQSTNITTY